MVNATHTSYTADDRSYLSILKKEIRRSADAAGFDEKKLNALDIVVAELTSNLVKHATGGELLAGIVATEQGEAFEMISIDHGPGIRDTAKMLQDGASTTGTLGQGLGSIQRMSDFFDVYSIPGWGTIIVSRIFKKISRRKPVKPKVNIRAIVVSKPGQEVSGDGTFYFTTDTHLKILVADGLGHGKEANLAVNEAVTAFKACPDHSPVDILRFVHNSIKRTRGMVGTIMVYDLKQDRWSMAGVGNIMAKLCSALNVRSYISYNGIIGHNIPGSMKNHEFEKNEFQQMILCSDGIKTRWDHTKYPSILKHDSSILAAAIYKDFARRTDDMSVISVRLN